MTKDEKKNVNVAEQERLNDSREAGIPWKKWGPYLTSGSGARSVKTTAKVATLGITSPMIKLAHGLTDGERMAWEESPTTNNACVLPSLYGTNEIPSSRNASSASPTVKETMEKM